MPAAFVQQASGHATSGTTVAATFGAAVGSGNLVVGIVTFDIAETLTNVRDGDGVDYTIVRTISSAQNIKAAVFYRANVTTAPTTITATLSAITVAATIGVHEASGIATSLPLDQEIGQMQASPGTGTDAVTSTSVTTTASGEYIVGAVARGAQRSNVINAGTGYTGRVSEFNTNWPNVETEDQIQAAPGSIAAIFTQPTDPGDNLVVFIMTFKAATAGPTFSVFDPVGGAESAQARPELSVRIMG